MSIATAPLHVVYDPETDILLIDNIPYAGELFRMLSFAAPGTWLRLEDRGPSGINVFTPDEDTEKILDRVTGRGLYSSSALAQRRKASKR